MPLQPWAIDLRTRPVPVLLSRSVWDCPETFQRVSLARVGLCLCALGAATGPRPTHHAHVETILSACTPSVRSFSILERCLPAVGRRSSELRFLLFVAALKSEAFCLFILTSKPKSYFDLLMQIRFNYTVIWAIDKFMQKSREMSVRHLAAAFGRSLSTCMPLPTTNKSNLPAPCNCKWR